MWTPSFYLSHFPIRNPNQMGILQIWPPLPIPWIWWHLSNLRRAYILVTLFLHIYIGGKPTARSYYCYRFSSVFLLLVTSSSFFIISNFQLNFVPIPFLWLLAPWLLSASVILWMQAVSDFFAIAYVLFLMRHMHSSPVQQEITRSRAFHMPWPILMDSRTCYLT